MSESTTETGITSSIPSITRSDPTRMIRFMTICCIINALGFSSAGITGVISIDPGQIIQASYTFILGLVLLVEELGLRIFQPFVVRNFGFITSFFGRGIFLLIVGIPCFNFGIIGLVVGIYSLVNSLFNLAVYQMRGDIREYLNRETQKIRHEANMSDEQEYQSQMHAAVGELAMKSMQASVLESVAATKL